MKKGRKPIHDFSALHPGESITLTGNASKYPHQYIHAAKKRLPGWDFALYRNEGEVVVCRTV